MSPGVLRTPSAEDGAATLTLTLLGDDAVSGELTPEHNERVGDMASLLTRTVDALVQLDNSSSPRPLMLEQYLAISLFCSCRVALKAHGIYLHIWTRS